MALREELLEQILRSRDAKRDLNPRKFSFSFSNFENFRERGQRLGLRIDEGNPRNFLRFENGNEANNFEGSRKILENWPMSFYSEQGCRRASNIGGAHSVGPEVC